MNSKSFLEKVSKCSLATVEANISGVDGKQQDRKLQEMRFRIRQP